MLRLMLWERAINSTFSVINEASEERGLISMKTSSTLLAKNKLEFLV